MINAEKKLDKKENYTDAPTKEKNRSVKNVEEVKFANIIKENRHAKSVEEVRFVSIIDTNQHVKNVEEVQSANIRE